MRSLLFVPADSERKIARGLGSGADVVILDLEDSVAAAQWLDVPGGPFALGDGEFTQGADIVEFPMGRS